MKQCSVCGATFQCGGCASQQCWCSQLPAIMPMCEGQECRCPQCLKKIINEKIDGFLATTTVETAIPSQYQNDELIQDIDYYLEEGRVVFSAWYHRKRGFCCGNGCRHCPYQHINVEKI